MKKNKNLLIILLITAVNCLLYILVVGYNDSFPDSSSYLSAWESWKEGIMHKTRTPIYPAYLGILRYLFGQEGFKIAAIVVQHVVFVSSVYCFYQIGTSLGIRQKVLCLITMFYALTPGIFLWSSCILTESFAISGCVILSYLIVRLHKDYSLINSLSFFVILVCLIMLRPAFIYLLPVLGLFWGWNIFHCEKRRQALAGFAGILLTAVVIFSYMTAFKQAYGIFSSTHVSLYNRLFLARQYGLIDPSLVSNAGLRNELENSYRENGVCFDYTPGIWDEKNMKLWSETGRYYKYPLSDINDALNQSMTHHPLKHIKAFFKCVNWSSKASLFTYSESVWGKITGVFRKAIQINIRLLYFFLIGYAFLLTYWIKKTKILPLYSILFFIITASHLIVSIVGAQDEWTRLIVPVIPLALLMLGQVCNMIHIKTKQLK